MNHFFEGRGAAEFTSGVPRVTHPREVRAIPIDFKDGNSQSSHSGPGPTTEDVSGSAFAHGPEIHANVIVVDEEDEDIPTDPNAHSSGQNDGFSGGILHERHSRPSAEVHNVPNNDNDIEEEMIQAAIEASKREDSSAPLLQQRQPYSEDTDLAHAVSLSLKTAEQDNAMREQGGLVGAAEMGVLHSSDVAELGKVTTENERQGIVSFSRGTSSHLDLEAGSTSVHDEAEVVEVVEEEPLVRQRSRRVSFESVESDKDAEEMEDSPPSSPGPRDIGTHPRRNGDAFHSDEFVNKLRYAKEGAKDIMDRTCADLPWKILLEVDGKDIEIPKDVEGVIVLNIGSYMGGVDLWQNDYDHDDDFNLQSMHDKLLEVVCISGAWHLGKLQVGLSQARRLAQGGVIRIQISSPFPIQIDGEPFIQPPGCLEITHHGQEDVLERAKKAKEKAAREAQEFIPQSTTITTPTSTKDVADPVISISFGLI